MLELKEIRFLKNYKILNELSIKIYELFIQFACLEFENKNIKLKKQIIENDFLEIQDKIEKLAKDLHNKKDTKNILDKKLNNLTIDDILMF